MSIEWRIAQVQITKFLQWKVFLERVSRKKVKEGNGFSSD